MKREDGRTHDRMRRIQIARSVLRLPAGSAVIRAGNTQVLCAATVEERVPQFLRGNGQGWITAEYAMLPGSGNERIPRNKISGRGMEIQRLIGRSLRSVVDLKRLGERTITLDCDVLEADGGTRTAAITAAYVALCDAVRTLLSDGKLAVDPILDSVAAVSVGRVDGKILLDLCQSEDVRAEVDFNLVATGKGRLVEVQGTAEKETFSPRDLQEMVRLGLAGVRELSQIQERCLKAAPRKLEVFLSLDGAGTKKAR